MSTTQPKRLSYTRRDLMSMHDDVDLYIKQFIPRINDTSQANTGRLFLTIIEALIDNLNFSVDQQHLEAKLMDARQRKNIIKLAYLIGYLPKPASAASVDLTFTLLSGVAPSGGYPIPVYTREQTAVSPLVEFITAESGSVPEGETSVSIPAVQGIRIVDEVLTNAASGKPNQIYTLASPRTPHEYIEVRVDGVLLDVSTDFAEANADEITYILRFDENDYTSTIFGDGEFGKAPPPGAEILTTYIQTVGATGNVAVDTIKRIVGSLASDVGVTNHEAAAGGAPSETDASIKRNAPASYRSYFRAVTRDDYEAQANAVSGVFTSYAQWSEGARTDIYIMPEGGGVASSLLVSQAQARLDERKVEGAIPIVHALDPADIYIVVNIVAFNSKVQKTTIKQKVRTATVDALDFRKIKPGRGFTLSDLSGLYENMDNGKLVDYADFRVLTRIPRVTKSNPSSPDFYGRIKITDLVAYDQYLVTAVTSTQFSVSINGHPQSVLGDVAVDYETDRGEVTFTLGETGDTFTIGDTWRFDTSKYRDNLVIGDNEFMRLIKDTDLVVAVFYPGEYDIKTQSAL